MKGNLKRNSCGTVVLGQRVKVSYYGTLADDADGDHVWVRDSAGVQHTCDTLKMDIEAADPEHWPPEPGDTWKADGQLWHVIEGRTSAYVQPVRPKDEGRRFWDIPEHGGANKTLADFADLNPVLLFRPEN